MKLVKIYFEDGDTVQSRINGTDEEIKNYYAIGKGMQKGIGLDETFYKITKLEFLEV